MNTQEISDRLAACTQRLLDAKFDGFTTLTFWDKRMKLTSGNYSMFLRANIYGKPNAEINVGGEDLAVMFAEFDRLIIRHIEAEHALAKTLGIEVAA